MTSRASAREMTRKADFNAEEWSKVVDGPLYAGMLVISAERGGTLRETAAMSRVYQDARQRRGASELLDELISSPPSIDADRIREAGGDVAAVTGSIFATRWRSWRPRRLLPRSTTTRSS